MRDKSSIRLDPFHWIATVLALAQTFTFCYVYYHFANRGSDYLWFAIIQLSPPLVLTLLLFGWINVRRKGRTRSLGYLATNLLFLFSLAFAYGDSVVLALPFALVLALTGKYWAPSKVKSEGPKKSEASV